MYFQKLHRWRVWCACCGRHLSKTAKAPDSSSLRNLRRRVLQSKIWPLDVTVCSHFFIVFPKLTKWAFKIFFLFVTSPTRQSEASTQSSRSSNCESCSVCVWVETWCLSLSHMEKNPKNKFCSLILDLLFCPFLGKRLISQRFSWKILLKWMQKNPDQTKKCVKVHHFDSERHACWVKAYNCLCHRNSTHPGGPFSLPCQFTPSLWPTSAGAGLSTCFSSASLHTLRKCLALRLAR